MPKLPRPPKHVDVHGTRKQSMPLDMLIQAVVKDLFLVFAGNGYPNVGFALLVQDLSEEDSFAMSGNLQPEGMEVILDNAKGLLDANKPDAPRIVVQ